MSEIILTEHALQLEPYFIIYKSNKAKDASAANTYSHSNFDRSSIFYRAEQHEKEVQTLKTQIKSYKRRLKVMPNIYSNIESQLLPRSYLILFEFV